MKQEHVLSCQVARYLRMRGYVTLDCDVMSQADFEIKLRKAYKAVEKFKANELFDDLKQEIAVSLWQNPNDDLHNIILTARKKVFGDEAKHQRARAPHIYNDDGECVDDDLYYIDQTTVEQGEVRESPVTDEMKEKVAAMVTTRNLICRIFNCTYNTSSFLTSMGKVYFYLGHNSSNNINKFYKDYHTRGIIYYENQRNKRVAIQAN